MQKKPKHKKTKQLNATKQNLPPTQLLIKTRFVKQMQNCT